jgi:hypothetical protein
LALGVHEQKDLDQAITAHGRILHDATVASINTTSGNNLGTINWQDAKASSLSEMVTHLAENFDKKVLDNQVATALLTGIVSETDRFSNSRTTPDTMKASAQLMAAGANQQLVATKLEVLQQQVPIPASPIAQQMPVAQEPSKSSDGMLRIEHIADDSVKQPPIAESDAGNKPDQGVPKPEPKPVMPTQPQIHIDDQGHLHQMGEGRAFLSGPGPSDVPGVVSPSDDDEKPSGVPDSSKFVFTPPAFGGALTANSQPEGLDPSIDPLSTQRSVTPLLAHSNEPSAPTAPAASPAVTGGATTTIPNFTLPEPTVNPGVVTSSPAGVNEPVVVSPLTPNDHKTLSDIEAAVDSPHVHPADLGDARSAVTSAIDQGGEPEMPKPIAALNAQPLGDALHASGDNTFAPTSSTSAKLSAVPLNPSFNEPAPDAASPSAQPLDMPLPPTLMPAPASSTSPTSSNSDNPSAPPPVPPPMMPLISPNGK